MLCEIVSIWSAKNLTFIFESGHGISPLQVIYSSGYHGNDTELPYIFLFLPF